MAVTYPDATRVNCLLTEICVERGWCLGQGGAELVGAALPEGLRAVVDALVRAELQIEPIMLNREDRRWLEQLLWPRVGERMIAWRAEQDQRTPPPRALVVEVPLLFESGHDRGYDATIAVIADEAIRQARAGARGHQALDERVARQLTQEEKSQLATYTVVNDGTEAELEARLSSILEMLST